MIESGKKRPFDEKKKIKKEQKKEKDIKMSLENK